MRYRLTARSAALVLALAIAPLSQAAIITHGFLASDDATSFITNTVTGRQYTRFGSPALTFAQVQIAIAPGGSYAGWQMATSSVSDEFVAAMLALPSSPCDGDLHGYGTFCGAISYTDGDFGNSFGADSDFWWYMLEGSQPGDPDALVGLAQASIVGELIDYGAWADTYTADVHASGLNSRPPDKPISYMLVREAQVPAPGTLGLLGLGFAGLGITRKRKPVA